MPIRQGWQGGEKRCDLLALERLPEHGLASFIHAMHLDHVLGQIDTNCRHLHLGRLSCLLVEISPLHFGTRMSFRDGATIPLTYLWAGLIVRVYPLAATWRHRRRTKYMVGVKGCGKKTACIVVSQAGRSATSPSPAGTSPSCSRRPTKPACLPGPVLFGVRYAPTSGAAWLTGMLATSAMTIPPGFHLLR